ncbi:fibrinogen gamma chain-like isoform X2 [Lineus longissimus]|uniref:fibrinogen gamma chain-like isoform X2 n=1 Tax=Lineus longissimus TaxID=88925 RepID=UPI00315D4007
MSSQKKPHLPIIVALLPVFSLFVSAAIAATEKETIMFKCGDGIGIPTANIKARYQARSKVDCAVLCLNHGDACENMHYNPSKTNSVNCFIGSAINLKRGYGTCTGLVTTPGVVSFYRKVECQGGNIDNTTGMCVCPRGYGGKACATRINDCSDTTATEWHGEWVFPPNAPKPFEVMCYSQITFLMKRNWNSQATVSFNRSYEDYAAGFGGIKGYDYYLGNRKIHYLTNWTRSQYISLKLYRFKDKSFTRYYSTMRVQSEADKFRITMSVLRRGENTDADGDAFLTAEAGLSIDGMPFTTYDNDQDNWANGNCANEFGGGWWYNNCTAAPLTAEKLMNSTQITAAGGPDSALHVDWMTQAAAKRSIGISLIMFGLYTF